MNTMKIKSTSKIDLSHNIKTIIQKKGIRKTDIIRQMQLDGIPMTKQRFYKLENNQANITADELAMIAKIVDCDISDFFCETK
ncbi:MAG: helix-turn-helix domain-containing protein [Lachnospiraceae bacterium]|nr:helix-turn-helix domain-containing protein [Lachnospiraceae bacterium]